MKFRSLMLAGVLVWAVAAFGAVADSDEKAATAEKPSRTEKTAKTVTPPKTVTPEKAPSAEKTAAPESEKKKPKKPVAVKPKIAVFSFTTIDIQGQHFRDFTDRTETTAPQSSLTEAELGAIDEVMLGYVKMIDAEEERVRRAHDRRRLDDENDRNLARQNELADKLLKTPQRSVVVGAAYMESALGRYDSVDLVDRGEVYKAFRNISKKQAGEKPSALPEALQISGATHVLYGTVADFRVSKRVFSGYGVSTEAIVYELDVMIKIADIGTNQIIFSGVFTGQDREFKSDGMQTIDSGRFDRLMKSATEQAALSIDKTFDPQD